MKFKERLKDLRTDKDINQTELGIILNMSQKKISRMETGQAEPSLQDIEQICRFFNISADYILGFTNDPKPLPKR